MEEKDVKRIDARERNARVRPVKLTTKKFYSPFPNHLWCADLIDFRYYPDENNGYKYILVCIDVYSRYVWMVPMKSKSGEECVSAFKEVLENANKLLEDSPYPIHPNYLATDDEEGFKKYTYDKFNMKRYIVQGNHGAAPVEAFIREFKKILGAYFTEHKNHEWLQYYEEILEDYNENRVHSATKSIPVDLYTSETATKEKSEPKLRTNDKTPKFEEGDIVRFKYEKNLMKLQKKALTPSYSKDLFTVKKVLTGPPLPIGYKLRRMTHRPQPNDAQYVKHRQEINNANNRTFYWHELKKSKLKPADVEPLNDDKTL